MRQTFTADQRTRWLAKQTGVHLPYLDLLPASETMRYARAGIAMAVSVLTAIAGWGLVGATSATALTPVPRIGVALAAGLAAGTVIWSIDRELISGDGHLGIRGVIAAVNALFVGELVLLALFAPFVNEQISTYRTDTHQIAVSEADETYAQAITSIDTATAGAAPDEPAQLAATRSAHQQALAAVTAAEEQLAALTELRTAEVTGRVVVDDNGQELTSGQTGDRGLATESLDRQIDAATNTLDRATNELDATNQRLATAEDDYATQLEQANTRNNGFDTDRATAQRVRDETIATADTDLKAPIGLLRRIHVFHQAVWTDLVLAIAVFTVHLAILAAELSVVLWAINDRRRPNQLYPDLVTKIDGAAADHLADLATTIVATTINPTNDPAPGHEPAPTEVLSSVGALDDGLAGFTAALNYIPPTVTVDGGGNGVSETVTAVLAPSPEDANVGPPVEVSAVSATDDYRIAEILRSRPIEVQILGPTPTVTGIPDDLRPKHLAALIYLTLYQPVSIDEMRQTFWNRSKSIKASSNALSTIRTALGTTSDGTTRLSTKSSGELTLTPDVTSDWERFHTLTTTEPANGDAHDRLAYYVAALNLITGRPCATPPGSRANWAWFGANSHTGTRIAAATGNATNTLITLAAETSTHELIEWATNKARLVNPHYQPPQPDRSAEATRSNRVGTGTR